MTIKCPLCHKEMEKGILGSTNESWISEKTALATMNWLAQAPTLGQPRLWAYRCPKCGKVELFTEVEENK